MATVVNNGKSVGVGHVLGLTFTTLSKNLPLYFGLSVLLTGLPTLLLSLAIPSDTAVVGLAPRALLSAFLSPSVIVAYLILLVGSFLLQAALIRATIEDLNGIRPDFMTCLKTGFGSMLPLIGISLLVGLGVMLGFLLFIVPGIILAIMWSVAIPVHVEERTGVMASLARSRALTSGSRWPILRLLIIVSFIAGAINKVAELLFTALGTFALTVGGALVGSIATALVTTAFAVIYVELRTVKEGASVASLAEVFA